MRGSVTPLAWLKRGAFAIADQGLMSGSNFVLTILLARWLVPEQYGAYALALSIFYFVSSGHQALMLEPMSVLGPSEYSDRQREYGGALLWFQAAFSLLVFLVFGTASLVAWRLADHNLAAAMLGLAIGTPGILLFWLSRISCYARFTPATAASGACIYSLTLLGGAWALSRSGLLSAFTALVLMGTAAVVVSAALISRARPIIRCSRALWRDVATRHWSYGRWALGSSLVIWVPSNIFYSIITAFVGIGSAGAFRAVMNLMFPVTHTCSALSLVFQPQLSKTASHDGAEATLRPVRNMAALYATGALAWLGLVAFQTDRVWRLLYHGRFHEVSGLAVWLLIGVVFQVAAYAPAVGLRALQSPSHVFAAYSIAAVVCIAGGIPATRLWGLPGAIGCYAVALMLSFTATTLLYRRRVRGAQEAHETTRWPAQEAVEAR